MQPNPVPVLRPEAGPAYLRRDRCPCCGASSASTSPAVASRPRAESLSIEDLGPFLSGYTARRVFFTYHRCRSCTALYCPEYFSQEQLDSLYGRQTENMAEAPLAARSRTQRAYFELLRKHSSLTGDYLELGADIGLFAELCHRFGRIRRFWLYEPNLNVHAALATRLERADCLIRGNQFSARDIPSQSISVAVLIHVLDHLLDLEEVLAQLHRSLTRGGILLVVTHDSESALARVLGRRWPPFTLQHPHLFSGPSLSRLFERTSFDLLELVKTRNYFPMTYLIGAGVAVLGGDGSRVPQYGRPLLGLRLGNIAAIARRRA